MEMMEAIANRVSRRNYTGEPIAKDVLERISVFVQECNRLSGLDAALLEDGSAGFRSVKKTYGMFSNVRTVILLKGQADMPHFMEKAGYYGEELMLRLVTLGLGTCWVGGTFDREAYTIPENEEICCAITVGHVSRPGIKDSMMINMNHTKRKPLSERLDSDCPLEELPVWVREGMDAVIMAPSAVNRQKPHFYFQDGRITADVTNDYKYDLIDLGIAKFHFSVGAGGQGYFDFGNGAGYIRR